MFHLLSDLHLVAFELSVAYYPTTCFSQIPISPRQMGLTNSTRVEYLPAFPRSRRSVKQVAAEQVAVAAAVDASAVAVVDF